MKEISQEIKIYPKKSKQVFLALASLVFVIASLGTIFLKSENKINKAFLKG